ncbi:MAG: DUF805 domain-containing protein [Rubrivivax sp.]
MTLVTVAHMLRFDRPRFVALGLVPAVNAVALLIYGLYASTAGSRKEGGLIPAIAALAALLLLCTAASAIKRGRDLGYRAVITVIAFVVALGFGPVVLLLAGYLAVARSNETENPFGPPPPSPNPLTWVAAGLLAFIPWLLLAILVRLP